MSLYVIKFENDKSLISTIQSTIHQGECNTDTLVFLMPKKYGEANIADCSLLLRYIDVNEIGHSEELEMYPLPYNENYLQYRLSVTTKFTKYPGEIELWLTAINKEDAIVLKSDSTTIKIEPSKNIADYLPQEDLDQLDQLEFKIDVLEKTKADSLAFDLETEQLQLSANGTLIGDAVDMSKMINKDDVIHFDEAPPSAQDPTDEVIYF